MCNLGVQVQQLLLDLTAQANKSTADQMNNQLGQINSDVVPSHTVPDPPMSVPTLIAQWETGDNDKPFAVTKVFPSKANSTQAVKDGGMYHIPSYSPSFTILGIQMKGLHQKPMDDYLGPLLQAAEQFFKLSWDKNTTIGLATSTRIIPPFPPPHIKRPFSLHRSSCFSLSYMMHPVPDMMS